MEKQVKMSIETAREWYELAKENKISGKTNPAIKFLEENFTKEELEGKKGFTWEESFNREGYLIYSYSRIVSVNNSPSCNNNKNIFKTEAQAKSALAFAQLSHIVAKYNEGKIFGDVFYFVRRTIDATLTVAYGNDTLHLPFAIDQDAFTSMEVNRQLWLDYWMIEENK